MSRSCRLWMLTLLAVALAWTATADSQACDQCHSYGAAYGYAPYAAAYSPDVYSSVVAFSPVVDYTPVVACSPVVTQTCNYVAQTAYRPYVVQMPVVTTQAVTAFDPCTGCPMTVLRPVTSYVQQVRYSPVVTYRMVCSPTTCCPSPCCCAGPCTCPSKAAIPINGGAIPTLPGEPQGPITAPEPGGAGGEAPKTFKESSRPRAVPAPGRPPDRTTRRPSTGALRAVSVQSQAAAPARKPNGQNAANDGWRAAKR